MINIIKIIILAVVSAALAVVIEQAVAAAVNIFWNQEIVLDSYSHFTWFLALATVIEEISKYWAVYSVIQKRFGLEKIKFILASFLLGISWGILEIALVFFTNQKAFAEFQYGNPEIIFSFVSIAILHTLTAYLMGIFISIGTFSGRLKHLKILFFPLLIHLLFNFLVIQKSNFTNYLIIFSLGIVFLIGTGVLSFNFKKLA